MSTEPNQPTNLPVDKLNSLSEMQERSTPYFIADCFFVTVETVARQDFIVGSVPTHLLRTVLSDVKKEQPFQTAGFILLPNHFHLLVKPQPAVTMEAIVQTLIHRYERGYAEVMGQPQTMLIWDRNYQAHRVKEEAEFILRLDWMHYNPVFHKRVERPEQWPYSSYNTWLQRGLYPAEWGWTEPESIKGKRWG